MKNILKGMYTVFKHAFRPRETLCYPKKKRILCDRARGSVAFDSKKCIGCGMCKKFCPTVSTITIENKKITSLNLSTCANCGNCTFYCPVGAIYMTKRYELATEDKNDLL